MTGGLGRNKLKRGLGPGRRTPKSHREDSVSQGCPLCSLCTKLCTKLAPITCNLSSSVSSSQGLPHPGGLPYLQWTERCTEKEKCDMNVAGRETEMGTSRAETG